MLSSSTGGCGLKPRQLACARLQSAPTVLGLRKPIGIKHPVGAACNRVN